MWDLVLQARPNPQFVSEGLLSQEKISKFLYQVSIRPIENPSWVV